ncbi:MAG: hypothetical protein EXQ79_09060 [Acidimicrobiia bacterium]|nr:hypothetical protein [Acidimicrobiia bacterium]
MQRLKNSWELGKISWSVLKSDRTLAWFPVLSAVVSLVVFGAFAGLIAATSIDSEGAKDSLEPMGYVFVFAAYIALAFVGNYFLGALVYGANQRLNGHEAKFGDSIGAANAKIHRILPWALVSATVSVVLQAIEERLGWFGVLIARVLGAAWAVVTFLTMPVIMLEDLGPIQALKRSGHLLKQTWGENLGAQAGFSILGFVAMLPAALLIALASSADTTGTWIVLGGIAAVWLIIVVVVLSAMSGIYRTALYRFAVDGTAPPAFAGSNLGGAFGERRRGGGWLS